MSSPIGFFLSSVKFIGDQIDIRMCGTQIDKKGSKSRPQIEKRAAIVCAQ